MLSGIVLLIARRPGNGGRPVFTGAFQIHPAKQPPGGVPGQMPMTCFYQRCMCRGQRSLPPSGAAGIPPACYPSHSRVLSHSSASSRPRNRKSAIANLGPMKPPFPGAVRPAAVAGGAAAGSARPRSDSATYRTDPAFAASSGKRKRSWRQASAGAGTGGSAASVPPAPRSTCTMRHAGGSRSPWPPVAMRTPGGGIDSDTSGACEDAGGGAALPCAAAGPDTMASSCACESASAATCTSAGTPGAAVTHTAAPSGNARASTSPASGAGTPRACSAAHRSTNCTASLQPPPSLLPPHARQPVEKGISLRSGQSSGRTALDADAAAALATATSSRGRRGGGGGGGGGGRGVSADAMLCCCCPSSCFTSGAVPATSECVPLAPSSPAGGCSTAVGNGACALGAWGSEDVAIRRITPVPCFRAGRTHRDESSRSGYSQVERALNAGKCCAAGRRCVAGWLAVLEAALTAATLLLRLLLSFKWRRRVVRGWRQVISF
eukprot:365148-Chlamydomonas_euryale.AAC.11